MHAGLTCGCGLVPSQLTKLAPMDLMTAPFGSGNRLGISDHEMLPACQSLLHPVSSTVPTEANMKGQLPLSGHKHS